MLLQMENDLVVFLFFIYGIVATCFFLFFLPNDDENL